MDKHNKKFLKPPKSLSTLPKPILTPYEIFNNKINTLFKDREGYLREVIVLSWTIISYSLVKFDDYDAIRYINIDCELEPEFTELNIILEKFCPNISILQYKKLLTEVVEYKTEEKSATITRIYGKKSVDIKILFEWLVNNHFIDLSEVIK